MISCAKSFQNGRIVCITSEVTLAPERIIPISLHFYPRAVRVVSRQSDWSWTSTTVFVFLISHIWPVFAVLKKYINDGH